MTDEEMVKEYEKKAEYIEVDDYGKKRYDSIDIQQAFLAGLKAGRPQWHDLRENPNDLPKEDCQVITVGESPRRLLIKKVAYYLRSEKKFTIWNKEYENFTNLHRVIAWCEIPTFDKE